MNGKTVGNRDRPSLFSQAVRNWKRRKGSDRGVNTLKLPECNSSENVMASVDNPTTVLVHQLGQEDDRRKWKEASITRNRENGNARLRVQNQGASGYLWLYNGST